MLQKHGSIGKGISKKFNLTEESTAVSSTIIQISEDD
jgi:hypothetical protein